MHLCSARPSSCVVFVIRTIVKVAPQLCASWCGMASVSGTYSLGQNIEAMAERRGVETKRRETAGGSVGYIVSNMWIYQ